VHLVGFILRIYHDARSSEPQSTQDSTSQTVIFLSGLNKSG